MHRGLNCDLKAYHTKYEEFFNVQGLREGTPWGSPEKSELNCTHEMSELKFVSLYTLQQLQAALARFIRTSS